MRTKRRAQPFGNVDLGAQKVRVVRHTLHVSKETGRDVHSVKLALDLRGVRVEVTPDDVVSLAADLFQACGWLKDPING